MFNILKSAALSAAIGLGALAAVPAPAQADGFYLSFGGHGGRAGIYLGDSGRSVYHDRRHYRRDHDRDYRRGCSPERALWKADRMGIDRARIVDVDWNSITVRGRSYGDRVWVTFGRSRGCPVIG